MQTLFLFRDCYEAKYILSNLDKKNLVDAIVLETGKDAKLRKLKRSFKKVSFLKYPYILLNLFSLFTYSLWINRGLIRRLGTVVYPKDKVKLVVNDANEKKCLQFIQNNKPEIIFIYGTSLLKKYFIDKVQTIILNIHDGILPFYRNVHSDFWAYTKKDYKNVGVCIFYLDSGIDSGDIALQKRIKYSRKNTLIDLKVKNLTIIPNLVRLIVKRYSARNLKRIKQDTSNVGFYPTPTFKDFLHFFKA